jgi:hypothetical protein
MRYAAFMAQNLENKWVAGKISETKELLRPFTVGWSMAPPKSGRLAVSS